MVCTILIGVVLLLPAGSLRVADASTVQVVEVDKATLHALQSRYRSPSNSAN